MGKRIKNIAVSKRTKLLNLSKEYSIDFNRMLLLYMQEKFLSRLSKSKYNKNFFLKGGILMYGEYQTKTRSTKDVDLLADEIPNNPAKIRQIIEEILAIPNEDGLVFNVKAMKIENTTDTAKHGGLRIKLEIHLDTARQNLQIDIGYGDVISPYPIQFKFPVLLEDEEIQLSAYSWESFIAEKFESIVSLSDFNSRLKDFYDIHLLQLNRSFRFMDLRNAVSETFKNRGTIISDSDHIFTSEFKSGKEREEQWQAFHRKAQLEKSETFLELINQIEIFISPVIDSIQKNINMNIRWDHRKQEWINN
jgi:hypothetical protein